MPEKIISPNNKKFSITRTEKISEQREKEIDRIIKSIGIELKERLYAAFSNLKRPEYPFTVGTKVDVSINEIL